MAAKKHAAPKQAKPKKAPRRKKQATSSAPGEAAQAHQWLMETQVPTLEAKRTPEPEDNPDEPEGYLSDLVYDIPPTETPDLKPEPALPRGGRFVIGGKPGPGRRKGSRNKLAASFIDDLYHDWEANGLAVIVQVREERPQEYLKVVASILPKQMDVRVSELADVPDTELDSQIARLRTELARASALLEGGAAEGFGREETAH